MVVYVEIRQQSRRDASPAAPANEDSPPAEEQYHHDDGDALDRLTSDHHLVPVSTEIEADVASPPGPPASSWMEDAVDFTVTFTDATQAPQAGSQKKTTQRKSLSLKKPHRKRSTEDRESSPTPEKRRAVVEATVPSPILSQRRVVRLPSTKSSPAFRSLTDICSISTVLRSASPSPARRSQLGTSQHAGSPVFQPLANRANDRDSADFSVSTASSGSLRPFHSRRGACLDSDDIIIPPSQYYPPPTAEDKTKRSASAAQRDSDSSDVIQPSQYYPPSPASRNFIMSQRHNNLLQRSQTVSLKNSFLCNYSTENRQLYGKSQCQKVFKWIKMTLIVRAD
ncbi:uncharacterized protein LOC127750373 [Frankliniella occidentalis]|uniref:Uncharacterized protein LOC127750373 n=1 Tax=Frankliniella occidentalis TaxID=133901 RepID=A0A9C6X2D7_FRAOC|nr:uncharacterized protein LOC127750373 [Frankliniella occidentalis]